MKKIINGIKYNIESEADLQGADLRGADLQGADLRYADLQGADLRRDDLYEADLREANLRGANLYKADLRGTDLRGADLRGTNLDFSCFPLWCGSFNIRVDDNIIEQLFTHIRRLDTSKCSEENKKLIKRIPKRVENKLKERQKI